MRYQLPRIAMKAYEVKFLHADGDIPCRPNSRPRSLLYATMHLPRCRNKITYIIKGVRLLVADLSQTKSAARLQTRSASNSWLFTGRSHVHYKEISVYAVLLQVLSLKVIETTTGALLLALKEITLNSTPAVGLKPEDSSVNITVSNSVIDGLYGNDILTN